MALSIGINYQEHIFGQYFHHGGVGNLYYFIYNLVSAINFQANSYGEERIDVNLFVKTKLGGGGEIGEKV